MRFSQLQTKTKPSYKLITLFFLSSSLCLVYFLSYIFFLGDSRKNLYANSAVEDEFSPTSGDHIVFGIASTAVSWPNRKNYLRLWWNRHQMRGCVFVETLPISIDENETSQLPPLCVSEDTSRFSYTYRGGGLRSAIRVARVVVETVKLNHSNVRWYVFGDDDTVYFPENLVKILSKYDYKLWYYIGSNSESYEQNRLFRFDMAFGGGGFVLSYSLAKVLEKVFDSCIERYSRLYGSDGRVFSCLTELGVKLTHEPGFHQFDVRGDGFGILAAHPLTPVVSVHHADQIDPIFPTMTPSQSLEHLFKAVKADSQRVLQQTVCYDRRFHWTISVSWGFAVQIFETLLLLPDVIRVQETFKQWKKSDSVEQAFTFNTMEIQPDLCRRPTIFFLRNVSSEKDERKIVSDYAKHYVNCSYDAASPKKLKVVRVLSEKLDMDTKQLQAPRRQCCDVLLPSTIGEVMEIGIRECKEDELIYMHP